MVDYKEIVDDVVNQLENYDLDREAVIKLTRRLNRAAGRGISKIVREESYEKYLNDCREIILEIEEIMETLAPVISWNTTISGTEEYCELEILHAVVNENPLPSPEVLHTPSWIWITALGDVVGELRRYMLSKIIQNDLEEAKIILTKIQDIYDTIVGLEFPKSLVSGLRHKIDVARTLVDRCESDFATAVIHKQTKTTKSE